MNPIETTYVRFPSEAAELPAAAPSPHWVVARLRSRLAALGNVLPNGPRSTVNALCTTLGRAAWNTLSPGEQEGWTLHPEPIPSIDNGDGTWRPLPGVSFRLRFGETHFGDYASVHPPLAATSQVCATPLVNRSGEPALGVALFYTHSRTARRRIELPGVREAHQACLPRESETLVVRDFARSLAPREVLTLRTDYQGDVPHLRGVTWIVPEADRPGSPDPFAAVPERIALEDVGLLAGYQRTWAQELEHRQGLIDGEADPVRQRRQRFFFELDRQTTPRPDVQGRLDFALLGAYLGQRFWVRAEDASVGRATQFAAAELETWRERSVRVLDCVRDITRAHLLACKSDDQVELAQTFEAFAGGELGVFESHGVPNGINYFAFGELAILARELGHDPSFWSMLHPVLLRTAEIFVNSYHAPCGGRSSCAYAPEHNPNGLRAYGPQDKARLAEAWREDPEGEFARLLHAALSDELPFGGAPSKQLVDHLPQA